MERYQEMPHTADLAAKIYGKDLPGLFANAAFAMFDMMKPSSVVCRQSSVKVEVAVEAPDEESLLISFLNEILYISYIKKAFFSDFKFSEFSKNSVKAIVSGCPKGEERPKHEIKAATYHNVKIEKMAEGYEVTIVFDV